MNKNWKDRSGRFIIRKWDSLFGINIDTEKSSIFEVAVQLYPWTDWYIGKDYPSGTLVIDEMGIRVPESILIEEFDKVVHNYKERYKRRSRGSRKNYSYKYRDGPVPGTGWKGFYCWYRHPQTKNELTQEDFRRDIHRDYGIILKGRHRKPPTLWDDLVRSNQKSWKKHRKNQYKG